MLGHHQSTLFLNNRVGFSVALAGESPLSCVKFLKSSQESEPDFLTGGEEVLLTSGPVLCNHQINAVLQREGGGSDIISSRVNG